MNEIMKDCLKKIEKIYIKQEKRFILSMDGITNPIFNESLSPSNARLFTILISHDLASTTS